MQQESLQQCLLGFVERVNSNKRIPSLIKGWEPNIIVESEDSDDLYTLMVRGCVVDEMVSGETSKPEHEIRVCASLNELCNVFSGNKNAANSFLSGDLTLFASDKDQVKLDAIGLLVWGL